MSVLHYRKPYVYVMSLQVPELQVRQLKLTLESESNLTLIFLTEKNLSNSRNDIELLLFTERLSHIIFP